MVGARRGVSRPASRGLAINEGRSLGRVERGLAGSCAAQVATWAQAMKMAMVATSTEVVEWMFHWVPSGA